MDKMFSEYQNCALCPRRCLVDRYQKKGFCKEDASLSIDVMILHHGEEPCISHKRGSGTVFFTGCSLRCPFCQNMQISQKTDQKKIHSMSEFIEKMEKIILSGAENINFVTPDHFNPHIIEGIKELRKRNYEIPFVYNCSGYQSTQSLESIMDYIDIFLFDYKFSDEKLAKEILSTENYSAICEQALEFIVKNKGHLKLDEEGKAWSGVLVRHLVMPGMIHNSMNVFNNLLVDYGNKIYFSLMAQYSPKYLRAGFEIINRRVTQNEYQEVVDYVNSLGFSNGYIQEFIEEDDEFLPDFKSEKLWIEKS